MKLTFYKYQGTGNDFVMVDNRQDIFPKNDTKLVAQLCDRRFGIGADGLILLENHSEYNFKMVYYNSDGNESTMCGNGGRCLVAFAKQLGIVSDKAEFEAIDGYHFASVSADDIVSLQMIDVDTVKITDEYTFLNTGSPHHIEFVSNVRDVDVKKEGAEIRYSDRYGKAGSNINFVSPLANGKFAVRTYERGVEDETLSCGTGVTAVAIALYSNKKTVANIVKLQVEGGDLSVSFKEENGKFHDVFLIGPAKFVFKGEIEI
ncbi:diaminopimelate epimerase [Flavobacterium sediminis]|uniref:Diaminopimelate epimerase n=1 Tax=Flavobacterium sediminis TaxID=2201181 RepID=A0A2U8QRY4_9FLAO|nr:diaminopimelate epimerase [Flavobacterium sediminis]AWM12908.1 diaminopimelate epimerase [Flavobacterium sediminis]